MAPSFGLCLLFLATISVVVGASTLYKVGDNEGWRLPDETNIDMYGKWGSNIKFRVGDSILFEYRNDSVVRVYKTEYYHCNETSHEAKFTDGKTVFLLDKSGFHYFVSGDHEHCKKGQRLMIEVVDRQSPPAADGPSPTPVISAAVSRRMPSLVDALVLGVVAVISGFPPCVPCTWQQLV